MELTEKFLTELQRRLKIGNRRGVHLNAIPANSRYKFDLNRLSHIDKNLPNNFVKALLSQLPLKFKISWKDNVPDLNSLFEEDQSQLVRITKAFENLINQTDAIESEKGINTFGFGFPILARRDKLDNKLTVAPVLIWSLRIKRTKEFNTWEILRNEDDPIYINEVLINHLQSDMGIEIEQIPNEMLDDGLISSEELITICSKLIKSINTISPDDLEDTLYKKLENIISISDKAHYEKLPLNSSNSFLDFGGLFSIFEVQKQNIINDYNALMELKGMKINLEDMEGHHFQPISSIETDPTQQNILHSLEGTRNLLIQGPPGTGKSQTLTAVLINALENNRKTIVVCEKRTALEVLHNAIVEKGLNYHCVLIRDIVKDRKTVVDSVRDRVDNSEYKHYRYKYSKESLDGFITKAKNLIGNINKRHKKIGEEIFGDKNWTKLVGGLLKEQKGYNDDTGLKIDKNNFEYTSQELNGFLEKIQMGQKVYSSFLPIESTCFINADKLIGDNPYAIENEINESFSFYSKQLEEIQNLQTKCKEEFITLRRSELKTQINVLTDCIESISTKEKDLKSLLTSANKEFTDFRFVEFNKQFDDISKVIAENEVIIKNNTNNPVVYDLNKINSFGYKLFAVFSRQKKQTIADQLELQNNFLRLQELLKTSKDFRTLNIAGNLEEKKNLLPNLNLAITNIKNSFEEKIQAEFLELKLDSVLLENDKNKRFHAIKLQEANVDNPEEFKAKLYSIRKHFQGYLAELKANFNNLSDELSNCKDINLNHTFDDNFHENKKVLSEILVEFETIKADYDLKIISEFDKLNLFDTSSEIKIKSQPKLQEITNNLFTKITLDSWAIEKFKLVSLDKFISDTENLIHKKNEYFKSEKDLFITTFKWFQFYNGLSKNEEEIVNALKSRSDWRKSFLIYYFNSLLIKSANLDLPTHDDDHKDLNQTLDGIEYEQLKFIKEFWFSKQIDSTREFEQTNINLSVENLYNKRSSNKFKRLSLRQIVQFDADLFTNFFPIILTSPDVASNLFKGMNGYFDIVMFDEASQLRIEDNLPAILKGKQIIIAGDEHQMPPSNYFSKVFDGSIEDEDEIEEEEIVVDKDNLLLSCESLLDFASELNFQRKHLDFHYRSRHPYLIDFSNYAFYNQRLKPLPNNFDYTPIKYVQVNGTFSDHVNDTEAEMVLSIIDKNINRLPDGKYPSVGIATFNIAQRNLIKSKILERQKFSKYEEFNSKIQELEENGMFIKNLENIQGDERDVIILSTTYGISKDKKFAQRFGPINHSKGYKLLNVIVTRAKFKVYCCTSIPEEVFLDFKTYLIAEGSNNKRAVLFAYLAYCKAVSECNNDMRLSILTTLAENTSKSTGFDSHKNENLESPFEEEVYQSLADHFGTEKLISQLQFAGFRIDIVYDPKMVGVPKIAIECDGAKYHSSQEAYLYDIHRQKILEKHGFVFHRIWSTNWWRNSSRESTNLVDFIKQVESSTTKSLQDYSHTASAFTDDIHVLEEYISNSSLANTAIDIEIIQSIDAAESIQPKTLTEQVKLNSTVLVKYMNIDKNIKVQLVKTENNKADNSGVQKIYYKSPLAESLIGRSIGDIVKIGDLDKFVEIIKIN